VNAAALLLDIGNSRLKWALLPKVPTPGRRPRPFTQAGALALDPRRRILPGGAALARVFARVPSAVPIVGCNVAGGAIERQIRALARRAGWPPPRWVQSAARAAGVVNAYREPWRLGVDRWLALIGAHDASPGHALLIVSVGTAMTIDLIDAQGHHQGGLITPGPRLMVDALLQRTAGIRRRAGGAAVAADLGAGPAVFWARDTGSALRAGARQAAAALVARARRAARELLGSAPRLLLTGGGAAAIAALLHPAARPEPDLVLHGLAVMTRSATAQRSPDRRRPHFA
jgi:type III pantothenate kinase